MDPKIQADVYKLLTARRTYDTSFYVGETTGEAQKPEIQ